METLYPNLMKNMKIKNVVEYRQKQNRDRIKLIEELQKWCLDHAQIPLTNHIYQVKILTSEIFPSLLYIFFRYLHRITTLEV